MSEAEISTSLREPGVRSSRANIWRRVRPGHPARRRPKACIDQFEFPDIPCEYPVVWVKAREAAEICSAIGKRLCDAHEWEGACDGSLEPPDYHFDLAKGVADDVAIRRMRAAHNQSDAPSKRWSYGPEYKKGVCATSSQKSADCAGDGWNKCGSNTFPDGMFPGCESPLKVYDLNGNAAEHEPAAQRGEDVGPRQPGIRLHRDEGELVRLRRVPRARGLVPVARTVLAWDAGDGRAQPC